MPGVKNGSPWYSMIGCHAASRHGRALWKNAAAPAGEVCHPARLHVTAGVPTSPANNGFSANVYDGRGPAGVVSVGVSSVVVSSSSVVVVVDSEVVVGGGSDE
jgi:hypothetical protein